MHRILNIDRCIYISIDIIFQSLQYFSIVIVHKNWKFIVLYLLYLFYFTYFNAMYNTNVCSV